MFIENFILDILHMTFHADSRMQGDACLLCFCPSESYILNKIHYLHSSCPYWDMKHVRIWVAEYPERNKRNRNRFSLRPFEKKVLIETEHEHVYLRVYFTYHIHISQKRIVMKATSFIVFRFIYMRCAMWRIVWWERTEDNEHNLTSNMQIIIWFVRWNIRANEKLGWKLFEFIMIIVILCV